MAPIRTVQAESAEPVRVMESPTNLFTYDFMPHGVCYLWLPEILWTHVASDLIITLAYYSIPLVLIIFLRKRPDVNFPHVAGLFATFIFLCGTSHLVAIWVVWNGDYAFQGVIKALTAIVSIATAFVTWRLLPTAIAIPSEKQLKEQVDKATEELTQAVDKLSETNAELENFVSVASHDMKEPLRTLVSFSQLLERDLGEDLTDDVKTDLHHIRLATRSMQNLVQDLLDLARTSHADLRLEQVSVDECVDEALEICNGHIEDLDVVIERDKLPTVYGDKTLITHVFQNLLSNAIKFAKPGESPRIRITTSGKQNGFYVLGVADNGIGIAPKWRSRIFEPFQRLQARGEYEGCGIGLAICRKAVSRLGGRIWVEGEENHGSHFKFTVKAVRDRSLVSQPTLAEPSASHSAG